MRFNLVKASIALFAASIALLAYGTYVKATSANFSGYEQHQIDEYLQDNLNEDGSPGYGIGLALASAWPFVTLVHIILFIGFCVSVYFLRSLNIRLHHSRLRWVLFAVFAACCFWGILIYLSSAIEDLQWGFFVMAIAEVCLAIAVCGAVVGTCGELSNKAISTP